MTQLTHLQRLEAESIHIMREVVAEAENPVMLYMKGESVRVFPISNWTELDIWQYIHLEQIPIVSLYLAARRPVVERDGMLIMVDDDRMKLHPGEVSVMKPVRFRTLGCYPLTGAMESEAQTLPAVIQEMLLARTSERQGRVIDRDSAAPSVAKDDELYPAPPRGSASQGRSWSAPSPACRYRAAID